MPRGGSINRKLPKPDEVYQDVRITRFIHYIMKGGKKDKAKKIVYLALENAARS